IIIQASSGLSDDDIDRMVHEAEIHASEDKARRELIDLKNQADQISYQTEKQLVEYKDKIPSEDIDGIRKALEELKEAAKSEDAGRIKAAIEAHNQIWQKAAQAMYQSAAAQEGPKDAESEKAGRQAGEKKKGDGVVDAEFEVIDEEEKK
ncbi:MAG TPA: Hsp70 family protein, partial [Candidatus Krumholzibacterium sp.]|nr:Hsp70 family protein [Candidatus Krumholzibacterium sp.]